MNFMTNQRGSQFENGIPCFSKTLAAFLLFGSSSSDFLYASIPSFSLPGANMSPYSLCNVLILSHKIHINFTFVFCLDLATVLEREQILHKKVSGMGNIDLSNGTTTFHS